MERVGTYLFSVGRRFAHGFFLLKKDASPSFYFLMASSADDISTVVAAGPRV